ncbi:hypothetical protein RM553_10680 [Zunongwangia sp. F363]|uniref:Lipoprotein n=1 Tax=Autumnicola tepida TaxID=3075595 RepID=A0ABU3CAE7_9FLAO|nr:hypothetical protein [Zunongwangia sp. F363]MDT0643294.1 hypothetical protein [Zunongwangia sp. F363]
MKDKLFGLIIFSAIFWSCQEKKEEQKAETTNTQVIVEEKETIPQKQCFLYANDNDTINLGLEILGDQVTGYLMYHLAEKNKNTGEIVGEMKGDTLFAEYFFSSEGRESKRDVFFLKDEKSIIEGHAEMEQTEEGMKFIENPDINFDHNIVLQRTNCGVN